MIGSPSVLEITVPDTCKVRLRRNARYYKEQCNQKCFFHAFHHALNWI